MNTHFFLGSSLAGCLLLLTYPHLPASEPETDPSRTGDPLPATAISLFTSGVGYFEHSAEIGDRTTATLVFTPAQLNDALKSLVVDDPGGGLQNISYPSQDPLDRILAGFRINLSGNPSLQNLLQQLRGQEVSLSHHGRSLTGTVVGTEQRARQVEDQVVTTSYLNLFDGAALHSLALTDLVGIRVEDPGLQEDFQKALAALGGADDPNRKVMHLEFESGEPRRARVGYLIETPLWKTSYRLVLNNEEEAQLQGWAMVDNQTDHDWESVRLSLVSGRPISFIQDLYTPLYLPRTTVEPELYGDLTPPEHQAGMDRTRDPVEAVQRRIMADSVPIAGTLHSGFVAREATPIRSQAAPAEPMDISRGVEVAASAERIGELFEYHIEDVTLPRRQSAMLPIVDATVQLERLSIYNQETLAAHPLYAVRLKNTTDLHLMQGPVTLFDGGGYAGEARLGSLPPGQDRLLSYGVDLEVLVQPSPQREDRSIRTGRIVNGILEVTRRLESVRAYDIENKGDSEKSLLMEIPIRRGWELVEPETAQEKTDQLYRFPVQIAAGETLEFLVKEERLEAQELQLLPADTDTLLRYSTQDRIPESVREALAKVVDLRRTLAGTEREMQVGEERIAEIFKDQERIRGNLQRIPRESEYHERLMKQLDEQETELRRLRDELEELRARAGRERAELEDYVMGLKIQ